MNSGLSTTRRCRVCGSWMTLGVLALLSLGGCRYYEVTRADGTTERISEAEYESLQRTSRRLGNVPSTRIQRQVSPAGSAPAVSD